MAEREHPDQVGVRELRQNLSVYLRRVKDGETLEVTERGLPVAELRPRSPADTQSKIDQMIADGRIKPARSRSRDLPPPPPPIDPTAPTLSKILQQMRDEERW